MAGSQPELLPGADTETRPRASVGDPAHDWLCAWCHHRVASEKDRFQYDGRSEFAFVNPDGIGFNIITFGRAPGCRQVGQPTLDHTWFPQHAWSYAVCGGCGLHLGWHYTGPHHFVGLIRDRLVRALFVRN